MVRARSTALTTLVLLSPLVGESSTAQEAPKIVFRSLAERAAQAGHSGNFSLAGGTTVSGDDWATLIMAAFPNLHADDGSVEFCTATFVGPSVVLTAAHCVFDENTGKPTKAELALEHWRNPISLTCLIDARYSADRDRDFSLCHVGIPQAALDELGITRFDSLELTQTYPAGTKVVLTGYGCTNVRIENGNWMWDSADGWLRVGNAVLHDVPGGNGPDRNDYTVVSHGKTPTLCPGDSGGPVIVGVIAENPVPYRRIIAVNQAVDPINRVQGRDFTSVMTGIDTADFNDFLKNTYEKAYPADSICGTPDQPAGEVKCR